MQLCQQEMEQDHGNRGLVQAKAAKDVTVGKAAVPVKEEAQEKVRAKAAEKAVGGKINSHRERKYFKGGNYYARIKWTRAQG